MTAKYIIPCLFRSPQIVDYHRELVDAIADRFALTFTQRQRIPAHFTTRLDNLTILRKVGEENDIDLWTVHRSFSLCS